VMAASILTALAPWLHYELHSYMLTNEETCNRISCWNEATLVH